MQKIKEFVRFKLQQGGNVAKQIKMFLHLLQQKLKAAHLCETFVFPGYPLVFGFDRQFVLGCSAVQARTRLWNGI